MQQRELKVSAARIDPSISQDPRQSLHILPMAALEGIQGPIDSCLLCIGEGCKPVTSELGGGIDCSQHSDPRASRGSLLDRRHPANPRHHALFELGRRRRFGSPVEFDAIRLSGGGDSRPPPYRQKDIHRDRRSTPQHVPPRLVTIGSATVSCG